MKPSEPAGWRFDNSYATLPGELFTRSRPEPVSEPRLFIFNRELATTMGLKVEALDSADGAAIFSGNKIPEGAEPMAQAYAGHQFGHFTMLGDGRAILLGEHIAPTGARSDVQLKGSGRTVYSRRGDGRAALGPMLREYIISEAMHALGIPTTRSLAVVTTGEQVLREEALPGGILARVASSHIRVGTFEYAARLGDLRILRALADHTLSRHYPDLEQAQNPYLEMLRAVIERQAALIAQWLQVGFVHGVMNTDNMALSGETIDYGPCAFLDAYDPAKVFSSIDHHGRYAFGNQPQIAQWNLARLAETLLPLLDPNPDRSLSLASEAIEAFTGIFRSHWLSGMRAKLGLVGVEPEDAALVEDLLDWMRKNRADYTSTFRALSPSLPPATGKPFLEWYGRWIQRLERQSLSNKEVEQMMRKANPAFIPRNHRVEEALAAAVVNNDPAPLSRLLEVLDRPFAHRPELSDFAAPPPAGGEEYRTFCGT